MDTALVPFVPKGPPAPRYARILPSSVAARNRSEGVRLNFRTVRPIKNVHGVVSLTNFLKTLYPKMCYRMLGELIGLYLDPIHVYKKSSVGTWAMAEMPTKPLDRAWFKKHWMPKDVEAAFKRFMREFVFNMTDGRYAVKVTGRYTWHVELRRVA